MGDKSKIEWTDATWNPVRGCSVVSAGCRNCYAMSVAARFSGEGLPYEGLAYRNESGAHWTGKVRLIEKHLEDPLRWKEPRRIFVNSMSDLFHESIVDEWIDRIFAVMALAPQHTFQVLTKRPKRMMEYLHQVSDERDMQRWINAAYEFVFDPLPAFELVNWPLANVWLGVSVEDQKTANERIPLLLETPAAVRWISAEPLIAPVSFAHYYREEGQGTYSTWLDYLNWLVVGGESGSGARPCALEWIEDIVKQCKAANVPVFVKQLGAFVVSEQRAYETDQEGQSNGFDSRWLWRAGLADKKGGDIDEFPEALKVRAYPA